MKNSIILLSLILSVTLIGSSCRSDSQWEPLFNGRDLSNWDMHLGSSLGSDFEDLAAAATVEKVFSVVEADDENLIRISGEINGSLATRESYGDYHLRLVFRWGDIVYSRRNSGLLYHSFGEFGVAIGTWMANIECQMFHQNLGDTYLMANTTCETEVTINPETNQFVYTQGSDPLIFGEHANGRLIRKSSDNENPLGEWNTLDLYCFGRTAVHVVNGTTVMINENTGVYENGVIKTLSAGKIQIQSEGAELFIKSVDIKSIDKLPESILK